VLDGGRRDKRVVHRPSGDLFFGETLEKFGSGGGRQESRCRKARRQNASNDGRSAASGRWEPRQDGKGFKRRVAGKAKSAPAYGSGRRGMVVVVGHNQGDSHARVDEGL